MPLKGVSCIFLTIVVVVAIVIVTLSERAISGPPESPLHESLPKTFNKNFQFFVFSLILFKIFTEVLTIKCWQTLL
jgi:hypothetical protein